MVKEKISVPIEPPGGVLNGSECKEYGEPRELEITATHGFLMLRAVVEAINHYRVLVDKDPKYIVLGYEQYKPFIAECHAYFKDVKEKVFDEICLVGTKLKIILLPLNIGLHLSGEVGDVFRFCAQKELYP